MSRIKPPALQPGDTIGVVAPASNLKPEMLAEGVSELERLGLKVRRRDDILSVSRYTAGSIDRRFEEFMEMVRAPEVKAIFCARGGYGSGPLVSRLDPGAIREHPKILVGASDLTFLLNFFDRAGVVSFHGPMVAASLRNGEQGYDRTVLLDLLVHRKAVQFPIGGTEVLRPGFGEGRLAGGCLSIVAATLGTAYEIDTHETILILEDLDTRPYQIDRMITQLKHAGKFSSVRGVVFGEMLGCVQHPNQGYRLQDVLSDLLGEFEFPMLFGFPTGHTSKPNVMVPFGVTACLALTSSPSFKLLEPAVS